MEPTPLRVVPKVDQPGRARKQRTPSALPRESASDIAARIRKGRKPAGQRLFVETVKHPDDLVITSIGKNGAAQSGKGGGYA